MTVALVVATALARECACLPVPGGTAAGGPGSAPSGGDAHIGLEHPVLGGAGPGGAGLGGGGPGDADATVPGDAGQGASGDAGGAAPPGLRGSRVPAGGVAPGRTPAATPSGGPAGGIAAPRNAAARVAAALALPGLRGGEVTTQPLVGRLCGQLGALGVRDVVLLTPACGEEPAGAESGALATMAWDGLSAQALEQADLASAGNVEVIECSSLPDELRAAAAVARSVRKSGERLLVCAGDVVAHTEALARLCGASAAGALTVARARAQPDEAGADLWQPLRLSALDQGGAAAGSRGVRLARRAAVVAAGSGFHRVHAPNAFGCGVFAVPAAECEELAAAADELAALTAGVPSGPGGAAAVRGPARASASSSPPVPPGSPHPPGFADTPTLLLVGLVRRGVGVEAVDAGPLVCVRAQTVHQARAAAAELSTVDEDGLVLAAAAAGGGGLAARWLAAPCARHLARWARQRRLSPNALSGMSMGLGLLAAVWFSSGQQAGLVLGGSLALAAFVLARTAGPLARYTRRESAFGAWLHAVGGRLTEYLLYAGLAAGFTGAGAGGVRIAGVVTVAGTTVHLPSVWTLAVAAMILQALRDMIGYCWQAAAPAPARPAAAPPLPLDEPADFAVAVRPGAAGGDGARSAGTGGGAHRGRLVTAARAAGRLTRGGAALLAEILRFQTGERIAVIAVATVAGGARLTFLVLLGWGGVASLVSVASKMVRSRARAVPCGGGASLAVYRDDGVIARAVGRFVDGQLPPLLPTVVGVLVSCVLSVVGVAKLPGVMVLAPVAVMTLAALGGAHPHDGRLDWLVPPLLQIGEYVFLAALAVAGHVPVPLTFVLATAIAVHRYDVVYRTGRAGAQRPHGALAREAPPALPHWLAAAGLGWEGRMLAAALGSVAGAEPVAFAVLAVYLWVLFGWESLTGWMGTTDRAGAVPSGIAGRGFVRTAQPAVRPAGTDDGGGR